ncbi:MAG TPA: TonB-dependent receptor plug domain-containing protein [Micropepsaceae bacterium]|nr:TonB-dependent receptor plug domain-containing protein [Micropepsaceae bacterium]
MNPRTSKLTALFGSASFLTLAHTIAAQAQPAPQTQVAQAQVAQAQMAQAAPTEVPEQVLITGSLIHGAAAVGVPVTNLGTNDFAQTGSLTTADLFRTVPSALVSPGPIATNANNNIGKQTRVNIRNLDPNDGTRSLLMVDGYRFPPQGEADCTVDPSFIPAIALDRIDILVDGASATYGSDAVAGVVNIILKRGYDGAMTQFRTTFSKGKQSYQASQLWGRTWDGGDITLSYEWSDNTPLHGTDVPRFGLDFTPWGLEDRTPIRSSLPGTISVGAANQTIGHTCTNCWAIPAGSGVNFQSNLNAGLGPLAPQSAATINWATFSANTGNGGPTNPAGGTQNVFNPYTIAWYDAAQQKNSSVMTIDQRLTKDVSFFGEGFYSNRRAQYLNPSNLSPSSGNDLAVAIPTWNPYYPTGGAPTNLRIQYNMGLERPSLTVASELADRYLGGLNIDLPGGWTGKVYFSESFDGEVTRVNEANPNAVSAALGWTIPASAPSGTAPSLGTWTKPAAVPYLNLFCDPRVNHCNSPTTINYLSGERNFTSDYWVNEKGVTFDGPLFDVPAGQVKMAVGATETSHTFFFRALDNTASSSLLVPVNVDARHKHVWAIFTQVNVPVIGDANSVPLIRKLDIEGSWRHDQYNDVGGTSNPKVAFNWEVSEDIGLTFRGAWGQSFRAPSFAEESGLVKNAIAGWNTPLFAQASSITANCGADPQSGMGRLLTPGAGLTGWNGLTSNNSATPAACGVNAQPVGLALLGASGTAINSDFRKYIHTFGESLHPETAMNWGFGGELAPTIFAKGLDVQVTWYSVKINGALRGFANPNTTSVNDPTLGFSYIVPTDLAIVHTAPGDLQCHNNNTPAAAAVGGAPGSGALGCPEFETMVAKLLADPRNPVPAGIATSVLWINDGATANNGFIKVQGVDFNVSYDLDLGDLGAWNAGVNGTYYLHYNTANNTSEPTNPAAGLIQDLYHTTLGSVGGVQQVGVESLPKLRYRARLGWSDGPWSVTGFMDYQSHFFHTQNAPPNVNNQCLASGGTVGGGTFPCAITGYTNIEPSYYTFDLSVGYDTGDDPANDYLKHIGIQLVVQNLMDRHPAFEYRISTGAGNPAEFDISKSDQGRTIGIILTKTW